MTLSPGTRLGNYEILGALGAGGMGEVFRARDLRLGRDVALKRVATAAAANPTVRARFEREARAVASLNHPNIVILHSFEECDGLCFITMELVEGKPLDAIIVPGGLPLSRLLALAVPLARALGAAHARGIVHRDFKPRNVMVTPDDLVKVLDFGLARSTGVPDHAVHEDSATTAAVSIAGQVLGTWPYMAPEQVRGEPVDARADLFAFGVTLYELATGVRPFTGATPADVASSILRDTPRPVTAQRSDLPAEFDHLIQRCLAKEPAARWASAAELADALRALSVDSASGGAGTSPGAPSTGTIASLVVLPLDNVSRDPAQEYFADGMTEALISDLARLGGLRVISRTSAMKYKGASKAIPEIARELNVDAVLEGSALLVGNRVRISVQLISAQHDRTLWSDRYDRDLEDVLDVQSRVAEAVAREIALRLSPNDQVRLARKQEVHPQAHLEYMKGMHILEAASPQAVEMSLRHLQRALELDPGFAPAWAGLARCHYTRASRGMAPPAMAADEGRAAALRALAIDNSLADAHVALGGIQSFELDLESASRELERALQINPGTTHAWQALGRIYYCTERHAEAQAAMLKARSLDPLSMIIHTSVGDAFYYAREYERSIEYYREAIALDPRFDGAHTDLARSLEALGRFDEAEGEYEAGRRLSGGVALPSFGLAHLAAARGDVTTARRILGELTAARATRVVSAWGIAALHASLGDIDDAFQWLETAVAERATGLIYLRVHPRLDPLRLDARYAALVRRMGLVRD